MGIDLAPGTGLSFYITDQGTTGFQEGINVFSLNDQGNYAVNEGDSINVRGQVVQINGLTQINIDSVNVISTGNDLPLPSIVNTLDEFSEARMIEINNFSVISGSGSGSFNVEATNGTDTIIIRVDEATDVNDSLALNPLATGDTLCNLIGIGSQRDFSSPFTSDYWMIPMRYSDVTICRLVTGLKEPTAGQNQFRIYPNPTNGRFVMHSNQGFNNSTIQIQVQDLNGRIIKNEVFGNANRSFRREFNLESSSSGVYFISVYDGDTVIRKKLILQ